MTRHAALLLLLLTLPAGFGRAQNAAPPAETPKNEPAATAEQLEAWYQKGSEWQVGTPENQQAITDARQSMIQQGPAGLAFILTKLDATTTLNLRCISAVVMGLKDIAVPGLLEKLKDGNPAVRRNALDLLAGIRDPATIPAMLPLLKDENDRVVAAATAALANLKAAEAAPAWIGLLQSGRRKIYREIIAALGAVQASGAAAVLMQKLNDEFYGIRYAAQNALIAIGEPAFAPIAEELQKQLETPREKQMTVRINHLLLVLGGSAAPEHETRVAAFLENGDWSVRAHAAQALALRPSDPRKAWIETQAAIESHPHVIWRIQSVLENWKTQ